MSNPRRPRFGLLFYDDNDEPIENILTSATRPRRQRNPQPLPPSSPETPSPHTLGNPPPVTSPAPLATPAPIPMSSHTAELKAALPADFSGKNDDATCWIKAMKAYFTLNATLYSSDTARIMTTLNKMSRGRGAPYAETWYDRMADNTIPNTEKTFDKFVDDFESTFYLFDTKITAHNQLHTLRQQSFKEKDGSTNDGFQQYITNFQNLSMKAGTKDDFNLISQFSLRLDQKLSEMILSMSSVPTTSKGWINQSKIFHTQLVRIQDLRKGRTSSHDYTPTRSHHDPNAMDIDAVSLSKLTPVERVKCMKEGRCFRCRKPRHNAHNCHSSSGTPFSSPSAPCPHQIRTTQTQAEPSKNLFTPAPKSALDEYINSLKTLGKSESNILNVLTTCFEEPVEEIAKISTPGALDF